MLQQLDNCMYCTWRTQDSLTSKRHIKSQHLQHKAATSVMRSYPSAHIWAFKPHINRVAPSNKHTACHMRVEENVWSGTAGQSPRSRISLTACASVQFSTVSEFAHSLETVKHHASSAAWRESDSMKINQSICWQNFALISKGSWRGPEIPNH